MKATKNYVDESEESTQIIVAPSDEYYAQCQTNKTCNFSGSNWFQRYVLNSIKGMLRAFD